MVQRSLVSVVMPVFNSNVRYLHESVESILSQTYDEIEFIVVFDKSGSGHDELVLKTLKRFYDDHRLKLVVNQKKIGFTNSLNKGIRLSNGKYVGRMDSDDVSSPNRIQEQVEFLQREPSDIVGCWSHVIDHTSQVLGYISPPSKWPIIRKYLLFHNPFVHSSILFNRRVIETIGLYRPDFEPSEDYEFYLRAFSRGFKGANVPEYLHSLREHSSSVMHGSKWKQNRVAYLRCKLAAVSRYGFNKPLDVAFLGISPFSIFIKPSQVLSFKQLFGLYTRGVSP